MLCCAGINNLLKGMEPPAGRLEWLVGQLKAAWPDTQVGLLCPLFLSCQLAAWAMCGGPPQPQRAAPLSPAPVLDYPSSCAAPLLPRCCPRQIAITALLPNVDVEVTETNEDYAALAERQGIALLQCAQVR